MRSCRDFKTRMPSVARASSSDGVSVAVRKYDAIGSADRARVVLLVHANGFHGGVFEPVCERLCELGWTCYAMDLRGHGASTAPTNGRMEWSALADDVQAVVTSLGLHRCHALGHSCGGHALLTVEARRPGTFASIYAFEPIFVVKQEEVPDLDVSPGSPLMTHTQYLVKSATRRRSRFASTAEALEAYKSKPPMNTWNAEALNAYVNKGGFVSDVDGVRLACTAETEIAVYNAGDKETTAFGELPKVTCPVAVAKGASLASDGKTFIYSAVIAPAIVAAVRDGTLVEFPDNGHLGPMESPRDVADSARDFFTAALAREPRSKL